MKVLRPAIIFLAAALSIASGQGQPMDKRPSVLQLSPGTEIEVLEMFKTIMIETDEPALVLCYPTPKIKDGLCSEVHEIWNAFRPIVETQSVRAAVIFQQSPSGGGWTWIWKQGAKGVWDKI